MCLVNCVSDGCQGSWLVLALKSEVLRPAIPILKYFAAGDVWEMVGGESNFHVAAGPPPLHPDHDASYHILY